MASSSMTAGHQACSFSIVRGVGLSYQSQNEDVDPILKTIMKRTPQEKKRLSYARDRRNVYGEAPHAARKNIPLKKALRNRANRHYANQQLMYEGVGFDEELADAIESRIKRKAPHEWEKFPDAPLGEVVPRKSRNRAIMQEHGGRKAFKLVTRYG
jgi:hypothetical protein